MQSKVKFQTTATRSRLMSRIRSVNTTPEIALRKYLWGLGFRYRKNYSKLVGKPDIVFTKNKLAVFIDGEFWHGYLWEEKKDKIVSNRDYWIHKIESNIIRDRLVNQELSAQGWHVLRFWEHEIKCDIQRCAVKVIELITAKNDVND
ncbi:MAG: very short patch repair endonuclease [Anaerolineaceae bacterium]